MATRTPWTWEPTDTGYRATDGRAELTKSGKTWRLQLRDGRSFPLPRRASFDHAERLMAQQGAAP